MLPGRLNVDGLLLEDRIWGCHYIADGCEGMFWSSEGMGNHTVLPSRSLLSLIPRIFDEYNSMI